MAWTCALTTRLGPHRCNRNFAPAKAPRNNISSKQPVPAIKKRPALDFFACSPPFSREGLGEGSNLPPPLPWKGGGNSEGSCIMGLEFRKSDEFPALGRARESAC